MGVLFPVTINAHVKGQDTHPNSAVSQKSNDNAANKGLTLNEFLQSSPKEIRAKTGKKLNLFQRIALKIIQKKTMVIG